MRALNKHWTERSTEDFLYRISADFIESIESAMRDEKIKQSELAAALGVTEGRVSQVLNNPGNLTLKQVVSYVRALRRKVAIVTYNDGDPNNENGPVNAEIFTECWGKLGKPHDFFALDQLRKFQARSDSRAMTTIPFVGYSATTNASLYPFAHAFTRTMRVATS